MRRVTVHWFDDPLHQSSQPDTLWSTVNTAEVLSGVLTPLAWTFWNRPCELGMRGAFADLGVLPPSGVTFAAAPDERFSAAFFGRYAANVEALRQMADAMPGTSANALEEQLLGSVRPGVESNTRYRRYPIVVAKLLATVRRLPRDLARLRPEIDGWWRTSVSAAPTASASVARDLFADAMARFERVMRAHAAATMLCQAMYQQVASLASTAGVPGLETSLLTGLGDVEETAVVADLWRVAHDELALETFLDRHGYHGPDEGQLGSHSWREEQAPLLLQLPHFKGLDGDRSPEASSRSRRDVRAAAEADLLRALSPPRRVGARLVLSLAKRFVPLREVGKAAFLQTIDVARASARVLGEHLVAAGTLAEVEDVFFLTADELLGEVPSQSRDAVAFRRARYREYVELDLPDSWTGMPEPQRRRDRATTGELRGIAVSPGVYEGTAAVVLDPAVDGVEAGDVLVCRTTDPSWATLMYLAGALVIDIGGPISHGAIVARELGVPCVINTKVAVDSLVSGQRVRVDGGAGTVTPLLQ